MNIPYMIFIQVCATAIMCALVFGVRLLIAHVFKGRKQWSNRPYWWIVWANATVVLAKFGIVGVLFAIFFGYAIFQNKLFKKK